jgi:hypothetical protein
LLPAIMAISGAALVANANIACCCEKDTAVALVLHTAAFCLMHGVRAAIPKANPLASCEFATLRDRLIKIGARVIEHVARIRVQLPTSCRRGHCSEPSPSACCTPIKPPGSPARTRSTDVQKHAAWCMIQAKPWYSADAIKAYPGPPHVQ